MQKIKLSIIFVAGIVIGAAAAKLISYRTEFAMSVWSSRDYLHSTRNFMQKLAEDCEPDYKIVSAGYESEVEIFGEKVKSITKFPHYGAKHIQEMLENDYLLFMEHHKKMNEEIETCKNT